MTLVAGASIRSVGYINVAESPQPRTSKAPPGFGPVLFAKRKIDTPRRRLPDDSTDERRNEGQQADQEESKLTGKRAQARKPNVFGRMPADA
jgi:hypothetical protein